MQYFAMSVSYAASAGDSRPARNHPIAGTIPMNRQLTLERTRTEPDVDVLIVGAGING